MRIGREKKIKADMPYDPTWDNWRKWLKKKDKGNLQMKIIYGPKGVFK